MLSIRPAMPTTEALLLQNHYTPDEIATLLGMTLYHVRQAARRGELAAFVVDHRIVSIRRDDVLNWLDERRPQV